MSERWTYRGVEASTPVEVERHYHSHDCMDAYMLPCRCGADADMEAPRVSAYDGHAIDVGYVHVLTEPDGPCVDNCPHPSHNIPPTEPHHHRAGEACFPACPGWSTPAPGGRGYRALPAR